MGSRDSTSYGASVTGDLAYSLAQRGFTVVSGGAYGIDAHAHRAALAGASDDVPTIAVMAGGVDRFYPSGNEDLLRAVANQGAVLAEVPPGSAPTRYRFLQRNRLIAALASVTVCGGGPMAVGSAEYRPPRGNPGQGRRGRPGSCTAPTRPAATGCCATAVPFVSLTPERSPSWPRPAAQSLPDEKTGRAEDHDGLTLEDLILLDALPLRTTSSVEKL